MYKKARHVVTSALFKQSYRFIIVGVLSTIVNFSINLLFLKISGLPEISSAIGYVSGVFIGYPLNRIWSFESSGNKMPETLKYFLIYLITFFVNSILAKISFTMFTTHAGFLSSRAIAWIYYIPVIAVTTILNFIGCKFFVFKK
ncbi:GtrA family protein [Spirochaetota bacterium]